jgi:hypothetical protein
MDKVAQRWRGLELVFNPYRDSRDAFVLGAVDEVYAALEDSNAALGVILSSRFVAGIRCGEGLIIVHGRMALC